jgi:hypothetical protein
LAKRTAVEKKIQIERKKERKWGEKGREGGGE